MSEPTLLLVEDDDAIRLLVRRILGRRGFAVLEAENGFEALKVAEEADRPLDLLISDMAMPGMSGSELADALRSRFPGLKVLFMSGYFDEASVLSPVEERRARFIEKPFTPAELTAAVDNVLEGTPGEDG